MIAIMITMVIMAVLASLATPAYFNTVEQSRSNEAMVNLGIIHMGQKIYRINSGTGRFWNGGNSLPTATINSALGVDISAVYYTAINVTASTSGAVTYTARLTRNNVSGGNGVRWYQYSYTDGTAAPIVSNG